MIFSLLINSVPVLIPVLIPVVLDLRPLGMTAEELGLARVTLSRCLRKLTDKQAISYQQALK